MGLTVAERRRLEVLAGRLGLVPEEVLRTALDVGLSELEAGAGSVLGGVLDVVAEGVGAVGEIRRAAELLFGGGPASGVPRADCRLPTVDRTGIVVRRRR